MTTCSRSRCSRKLSYAPSHAIIVASAAYGDFFNCFDGDFRSMRSNGKQKIMGKITGGHLVQADETKARKKGASGYIWVFTNSHEVVYRYSESREADILHTIMREFQGVLVSDFYAAYDSIECQQQKCLHTSLRDLNNAVLEQPSTKS